MILIGGMREGTSGGLPSLGRDRCSWGTHEGRSRRETANAQGQRGSRVPCLFCVRRKRDLEHSQLTKLLFNLAESSIPRFRRVVCAEIVRNDDLRGELRKVDAISAIFSAVMPLSSAPFHSKNSSVTMSSSTSRLLCREGQRSLNSP